MSATQIDSLPYPVNGLPTASNALAGKYLTFSLAKEEFGIRVLQVREIIGLQDITAVPGAEAHVKGVINLRGTVVPVICLRTKFKLPSASYTQRTCIIVVQLRQSDVPTLMGVIVDSVSEVLTLTAGDIEKTPELGGGDAMHYLLGLAKVRERLKILVDIERVLTTDDLTGLEKIQK